MSFNAGPPARATHKTAVVLIPPEEVWPPIQAIRQGHDRHFRRWMPHITLIYPFRPRREFDALSAEFARACRGVSPFEIELAAFGWFRHPSGHTVWLAPEPREALANLQMVLWRIVPECDQVRQHEGGFTPHLSVGQVGGKDALHRLLAEWQQSWTPIHFQAPAVSLIWRNDPPDDVFRVGRSVTLGGENL